MDIVRPLKLSSFTDMNHIFPGPYYKYRVYSDMLEGTALSGGVNCVKAMLQRIKVVPIYGAAFLLTSHYFPLSVRIW